MPSSSVGKGVGDAIGDAWRSLPLYRLGEATGQLPISAGARRLLRTLIRRDIPVKGRRKGYVYAKKSTLAGELERSTTTIKSRLSELRGSGLIVRDRRNQLKIRINYGQLGHVTLLDPPVTLSGLDVTLFCRGCSEPLRPRRADQRHCNAICRKRAQRRRAKSRGSAAPTGSGDRKSGV